MEEIEIYQHDSDWAAIIEFSDLSITLSMERAKALGDALLAFVEEAEAQNKANREGFLQRHPEMRIGGNS